MSNEVKLIVTTDSKQAEDQVNAFGGNATAMGAKTAKATEAGRLGFFALGQSVEEGARSMGIANQATRQLGNSVERMASSLLPSWGMAIGMGVLAITSLAQMITQSTEKQRELREELVKTATSLADETLGMEKNRQSTYELNKQTYQLYQTKKRIAEAELKNAIAAQTQLIIEQTDKINAGGTAWQKFMRILQQVNIFSEDFYKSKSVSENWANQTAKDLAKPRTELEMMVLKLAQMRLSMAQLMRPDQKFNEMFEMDVDAGNMGPDEKLYQAKLEREASYSAALVDLSGARGDSIAEQQEYEVAAFDAAAAAKYATLKLFDEQQDFLAENEIRREALLTAQKQKFLQQDQDAHVRAYQWQLKAEEQLANDKMAMAQGTSMVMGQIYEISGQKMKAFYYLQQVAAAGEAFIQYQLAASKAVGQTGWFGIGMAAYFEAMSYAVPALIMAKTFAGGSGGGGGGGGGGSVGTFPVNSSTGIPSTSGQQQQQTVQHIYVTINSPLADQNWDRIAEESMVPALRRAADRNITVTQR